MKILHLLIISILRFWIIANIFIFWMPIQAFSNSINDNGSELLNKTKYFWENNQLDSVQLYASKLLEIAHQDSNLYFIANANYYLGRYYQHQGNSDTSNIFLTQSKHDYILLKDTLKAGITHFLLGVNYTNTHKTYESLMHYHESENYLKLTNDSAWNTAVNNYLSITYFEIGNYVLALKYMQASIDYLNTNVNLIYLGNNYNSLGNIYRKMKETEKEKDAYKKAISILDTIPLNLPLAEAYNNISELCLNEGDTLNGFMYLDLAKQIFQKLDYQSGLCAYYSVKAYYYYSKEPPNYDSVIFLSSKSIEIAIAQNDIRQYADAAHYLGRAYLNTNQIYLAEQIFIRALEKAKEFQLNNEILNLLGDISDLYEIKKDYKKALMYKKEYYQLEDSIYNDEKVREFTSLDLNHQFKQKQLKDSLKRSKLELAHSAEVSQLKLKQQTDYYLKWLYFAIIIILMAVFIILYLNISKKKLIKEKEYQQAKETIKLKNQEISFHLLSQTRFSHQIKDFKNNLSIFTNKLRAKKDREHFDNILYQMERQKPNPLEEFEEIFKSIYPDYFKNLNQKYPNLSARELQICALIRLNFSTKEISSITNLAVNTLETSRYRIRKKLQLSSNEQLYSFLLKI